MSLRHPETPDPASPEAAQSELKLLTRWDKWYAQENLDNDPRILAAPPSPELRTLSGAASSDSVRGFRGALRV